MASVYIYLSSLTQQKGDGRSKLSKEGQSVKFVLQEFETTQKFIIQINFMQRSIRRGKKRKIVHVHKDDQQLASDKLFQLSHYCEEKFQDESKMLVEDSNRDSLKLRNIQKGEKKQTKNSPYRPRPISRQKKLNLKEYRTLQMAQITQQINNPKPKLNQTAYNIFNTLQSKHVFVGFKKQFNSTVNASPLFISYIEFKPKKRIETMPTIQKFNKPTTIRTHVQQLTNQNMDSRLAYKIKSLFGKQHSLSSSVRKKGNRQLMQNKNLLEQKLRRELFDLSERKIGVSFF